MTEATPPTGLFRRILWAWRKLRCPHSRELWFFPDPVFSQTDGGSLMTVDGKRNGKIVFCIDCGEAWGVDLSRDRGMVSHDAKEADEF